MSHFDELSQNIGTKIQKACRKHPGVKEPIRIAIDPEVLRAIHDLIEHYKKMTYEEPISTERAVPESKEPLPANERSADTYG